MLYRVELSRSEYHTACVEVEADSEENAAQLAMELVQGEDCYECQESDDCVEYVVEVDSLDRRLAELKGGQA